ncbi:MULTISPECIES: DUF2721 domain-containing protein [unclassified Iodidimonas]|jgi:heme/copper-type cytochrome/quinol oxidase subunit 2|uniref:DUF2721 domain-containing protein n=1 Tax=unclassified Iodidimonas TaxID=2626145 RepID=UPI002482DDCA|nr:MULTISPECIES: DUF2721 domain-containing protein [unclassified Iodidimonas]
MNVAQDIIGIAHIIQLAVAPVFLLAGIGAILNVMTQRLARVVDRARALEADYETMLADQKQRTHLELRTLDKRMQVVQGAISLCTISALFVCLVVMVLFIADLMNKDFAQPVAVLFILAMSTLTIGLILLLVEISLATKAIRIRRDILRPPSARNRPLSHQGIELFPHGRIFGGIGQGGDHQCRDGREGRIGQGG